MADAGGVGPGRRVLDLATGPVTRRRQRLRGALRWSPWTSRPRWLSWRGGSTPAWTCGGSMARPTHRPNRPGEPGPRPGTEVPAPKVAGQLRRHVRAGVERRDVPDDRRCGWVARRPDRLPVEPAGPGVHSVAGSPIKHLPSGYPTRGNPTAWDAPSPAPRRRLVLTAARERSGGSRSRRTVDQPDHHVLRSAKKKIATCWPAKPTSGCDVRGTWISPNGE